MNTSIVCPTGFIVYRLKLGLVDISICFNLYNISVNIIHQNMWAWVEAEAKAVARQQ